MLGLEVPLEVKQQQLQAATSKMKAGGATAKTVDYNSSLQPHHHMLLSIFELIALCMCCGCICRGERAFGFCKSSVVLTTNYQVCS